jgi:hypothetical protein
MIRAVNIMAGICLHYADWHVSNMNTGMAVGVMWHVGLISQEGLPNCIVNKGARGYPSTSHLSLLYEN